VLWPERTTGLSGADPPVADAVVARNGSSGALPHGFVEAPETAQPELIAGLATHLPGTARLTVPDRLPALPRGTLDLVTLSNWPA
jgi:hypothetical protein